MVGHTDTDLEKAKAGLQDTLVAQHLDRFVDVDTIAGWLADRSRERDSFLPTLNMLTGLLDNEVRGHSEMVEGLADGVFNLYRQIHSSIYDRMDAKGGPSAVDSTSTQLPPLDWKDTAIEAWELSGDNDHFVAAETYDRMFRQLLRDNTTEPDIFRVFHNAGTSYFMGGSPELGLTCIRWALDLNPNYPLARRTLEQLQEEDSNVVALHGVVSRLAKDAKEYREKYDLGSIKRWSIRRSRTELESLGIEFTKQEFLDKARSVTSAVKLARELFYTRGGEAVDNSDLPWMVAMALWYGYCPEEPATDILGDMLEEAREAADFEVYGPGGSAIPPEYQPFFDRVEAMLNGNKEGFFEAWVATYEYYAEDRLNLLEMMDALLVMGGCEERVMALAERLEVKTGDPLWHIPLLWNWKDPENGDWPKGCDAFLNQHPHNAVLPNQLAVLAGWRGEAETAHLMLLRAVEAVERRRADGLEDLKWSGQSIRDEYKFALERLSDFYEDHEVVDARLDLLEEGKAVMEDLPKEPSPIERLAADEEKLTAFESEVRKNMEGSPPGQYYLLLKRLGIDFSTEHDVDATIREIPLAPPKTSHTRKWPSKIGRNEPCPCGSGKKYKKCCLKKKMLPGSGGEE